MNDGIGFMYNFKGTDNFYWCEVYTHERYREPLNLGEKVTIDYIMPVKGRINHE